MFWDFVVGLFGSEDGLIDARSMAMPLPVEAVPLVHGGKTCPTGGINHPLWKFFVIYLFTFIIVV